MRTLVLDIETSKFDLRALSEVIHKFDIRIPKYSYVLMHVLRLVELVRSIPDASFATVFDPTKHELTYDKEIEGFVVGRIFGKHIYVGYCQMNKIVAYDFTVHKP